jgi:hypothetical protein
MDIDLSVFSEFKWFYTSSVIPNVFAQTAPFGHRIFAAFLVQVFASKCNHYLTGNSR